MRIVAGAFKGRILKAPKGEGTRPTSDRVRESMMSAIASACEGFEGLGVLDAFAGSGALGVEALSRGAASALFCERDGAAYRVLGANLAALGLDGARARAVRVDVLARPPLRPRKPFDLVLLDPPYAFGAPEVLGMTARLRAQGALGAEALAVYEHAAAASEAVEGAAAALGMIVAQRKAYGDTVVDMLRFAQAPPTDERKAPEIDPDR